MGNQINKILVIEPDSNTQVSLEKAFKQETLNFNFSFTTLSHFLAGKLEARQFDAIIVNCKPLNGQVPELFNRIYELPIIAFVEAGEENYAIHCLRTGAIDYLIKDSKNKYLELLPFTIDRAIKYKREERELNKYREELEALVNERTRTLQTELRQRKKFEDILRIQRDIAISLSSVSDLYTAFNQLLRSLFSIEGIDCGGIYIIERGTGALKLVAHAGLPPEFIALTSSYKADSPQAQLVNQGKPVYATYTEIIPDIDEIRRQEGLRSIAVIPVQYEGQVIAVMNLSSHTHNQIPKDIRNMLEAIASQIGSTIARVRAETRLRESQKNLQTLFETLDDFIFIIDLNGQIINVNPVVLKRLGYAAEEILHQPIARVHLPEHQAEVARIVSDILAGETAVCQLPLQAKDGTLIQIESRATLGKWNENDVIFGIARDVTERKRTEDTLRKLSMAVNQSPATVVITDLSGKIEYVNPKFTELTGYATAEVIGKQLSVLKAGPTTDAKYQSMWKTISAGKEWQGEFKNRKKNGDVYWELATVAPIMNEAGEITHYIKVAKDFDEQKKAETELQKYREDLEELVKKRTEELQEANAELRAFAYSVSHDLRAPLRAMHGFTQMLLEECCDKLDETGKNYAHRIIQAAKRMETLIQNLLAYSRISSAPIEFHPVSMNLVVDNVLAQLEKEIHEKQVTVIVEKPLPMAMGHLLTIEQIVVNLLSNAIKFVVPDVQPNIEIRAEEKESYVRFWIVDNGIGISPEYHERIFNVFERLHSDKSYPGTGIGLAIVRKAIERLKGTVGVESNAGEGSKFWFELPRVSE